MTATADHLDPVHRGGADEPENWALACQNCNGSKSDMTIDEFREHWRQGSLLATD